MSQRLFFVLALNCLFIPLWAQETSIRLIVRGDDMGYSHGGNEALVKSFREGIETSIEVIVPSPWFPEAVRLLAQNPTVDVGIHLVLTSEWDNVKWHPLTEAKTLRDSNGYFFPMIWPNKAYPGKAVLESSPNIADIEKEWRAQIELAKKNIPRLSHLSGHMGCTDMNDEAKALTKKLAREYGLDIDLKEKRVKGIGYKGPSKTFTDKKDSFLKMLDSLEAGQTYLFVDHPGLNTPELQAIHHIGYENVAEDRQGVTDLYTDIDIKAAIKKKGIWLISYKDLSR